MMTKVPPFFSLYRTDSSDLKDFKIRPWIGTSVQQKRASLDKEPDHDRHIMTALVPYRNRQLHLATLIDYLYGYC